MDKNHMKTNGNVFVRLFKVVLPLGLLASALGLIAAAEPAHNGTALSADVTPVVRPTTEFNQHADNQPAQPAPQEQFDGKKLYQEALKQIADNHKLLADKTERAKWIAEWEKKFDGTKQLDTEDGTDEAILQMLRSLKQRYDYFMDKAATQEEKEEVDSSLVGIGVNLRLRDAQSIIANLPKGATVEDARKAMKIGKGHELIIDSTIEDGPASKVLKANDVITHINGKAVDGQLMNDAIAPIGGAEGTELEMTVERTDDKGVTTTHTFKITRAKVVIKVVSTKDLGDGVTYIKLRNFMSQNTISEMRQALTKAASGKAVIIDLRGNPGGSLTAVLTITSFILPEGTLLITNERDGDNIAEHSIIVQRDFILKVDPDDTDPNKRSVSISKRPPLILPESMPVIVLVDENSASASEILSGALQANKRAIVIGKPTTGKGVGQQVIDLPFGRRLHVTTFEFLPGGKKMDWIGIIPNKEVDQDPSGKGDKQLDEALSQAKDAVKTSEALQKRGQEREKENRDAFDKKLKKRQTP